MMLSSGGNIVNSTANNIQQEKWKQNGNTTYVQLAFPEMII